MKKLLVVLLVFVMTLVTFFVYVGLAYPHPLAYLLVYITGIGWGSAYLIALCILVFMDKNMNKSD